MENAIMVTGGAGFIGSNFILQWIKHEGIPVILMPFLVIQNISSGERSDCSVSLGGSGLRPLAIGEGWRPGAPWHMAQSYPYIFLTRAWDSGVGLTGLTIC